MATERRKLNPVEIEAALKTLPGWSLTNEKLLRTYSFGDFVKAWAFMSAAALIVQQMDHHPEWSNVYDRVRVELVTHDLGGISTRDTELAEKFEKIAGPLLAAK